MEAGPIHIDLYKMFFKFSMHLSLIKLLHIFNLLTWLDHFVIMDCEAMELLLPNIEQLEHFIDQHILDQKKLIFFLKLGKCQNIS